MSNKARTQAIIANYLARQGSQKHKGNGAFGGKRKHNHVSNRKLLATFPATLTDIE